MKISPVLIVLLFQDYVDDYQTPEEPLDSRKVDDWIGFEVVEESGQRQASEHHLAREIAVRVVSLDRSAFSASSYTNGRIDPFCSQRRSSQVAMRFRRETQARFPPLIRAQYWHPHLL